ncbi:MAG: hypothetical protein IPO60_11155 [Flavobacteriales bacterium]|nr:hypothetical protein [Flavobacteriales bacterium]
MSKTITRQRFKELINAADIATLFNELGWDHADDRFSVEVAKQSIELRAVAHKRGFTVFVQTSDTIPSSNVRRSIEKKRTNIPFEHLIVFRNTKGDQQVWQLAIRSPNQPITFHETQWHKGQEPELLYQKLSGLFIPLDEEGSITLVDVRERVTREFEKQTKDVTKKFYTQFDKEHKNFHDFIEGLNDQDAKKWYASLMLNRLMFIYFLQRKGFMDGKKDYLGLKLKETEKAEGKDKFYGFYRNFLRLLFHQGLGDPKRSPELEKRIGKVPYLNGGLFDEHELEKDNPTIQIKDEAFKKLFAFFDEWQWTLDTRQQASGNEVNPDVIGYIFEQYINDRAKMGAYYTKEDITEYIAKNTIIPWLFDAAKAKDAQAFKPEGGVWELLRNDPDRYIHESVKKGVDTELMEKDDPASPWYKSPIFDDLDKELRAGLNPDQKDLVAKRKCWNRPADADKALPTEIWRETIERRRRYLEVRRKLVAGEVTAINDLITYNLDIRQFAQDVLHEHESGDLVWAFYDAIQHVTVLDPTCGSGAFLFAALGILQPLYEECLQRMAGFRQQAKDEGKPKRWQQFQPILDRIEKHHASNRAYFIYKSIMLQNLYGVDIMPEAVEIAKLRLFLKLVSTVQPDPKKPSYGIEPLPDIDFNIRAGNTLVGFGTKAELDKGLTYTLDGLEMKAVIEEQCEVVDRAFERYKQIQLNEGEDYATFHAAKAELLERLKDLREELDSYLGKQYGKDQDHSAKQFAAWKKSHQPFHWFAEYYGIVEKRGGFDVIIGNPPYLEVRQIGYEPKGLSTLESNAVHSMCIERSAQVLNAAHGSMSMIVPLSIVCTQRMIGTQAIIENGRTTWYSNFAWRPGKLFDAVNRALTIYVARANAAPSTYSTGYIKWSSDTREDLFPNLYYQAVSRKRPSFFVPKHQSPTEASILDRVLKASKAVAQEVSSQGGKSINYRTTGGLYWKVFTDFAPDFQLNGKAGSSSRETHFSLRRADQSDRMVALLGSNLYWWWYTITSNLRDLNPTDINGFRYPEGIEKDSDLMRLGKRFIKDIKANSTMLVRIQKTTGETSTQSFKISLSKPILDEIDTLLAGHYGLSAEELDFIINYDIKYRMGSELEGEE